MKKIEPYSQNIPRRESVIGKKTSDKKNFPSLQTFL